jgi:murein DD-endopeptidase MepM/ murein hydrolase activator NlpD
MPRMHGELVDTHLRYAGFADLLRHLAQALPGARWLNAPDEILRMCDKWRCQQALGAAGVDTPAILGLVEDHDHLQSMLDATAQDIRQLQQLKNRFMEIATPASLRERNSAKEDGRGGPLLLMPIRRSALDSTQPLSETLDNAMSEFGQFNKTISSMRTDWDKQLQWLNTLPTAVPIGGNFRMSSGFGMRVDPFTNTLARHEGLDFTAMQGTPILATADGTVSRSGWEDTYGNIVEVTHAEGFMTRYAHISKRHVTEGQRVKRGQHIADVGSTGRSTGPHLHYEVFRHGHVLNPAQVLPTGGG